MIIAIDGPAGAGKSTAARGLAKQLDFNFLDTGAMYRAVALVMLESGIDLDDQILVRQQTALIELFVDGESTKIGEREVSHLIRTPQVSESASKVAANAGVRDVLVDMQRAIASTGNFVCEGRDQGSVVFPNAEIKFFVTASVEGRAKRRLKEIVKSDSLATLENTIAEQIQRDERDSQRSVGALVKAPDAFEIRTDEMTIDQVIEHMLQIIERKTKFVRSIPTT